MKNDLDNFEIQMQRFLIIQTAFIGDVVLATGMVEKLHHAYPEAQIDFLLRKGNEDLLANNPFVNEVLIWNKKEDKFSNLLKMLFQIRSNKYDKVINLQRFASTGFLTAFSNAKEKTVKKPVLAKRCRLMTLSYLLLRIWKSIFKRLLNLSSFLFHINTSFTKGLLANKSSLPFLNKKSICASGYA